MTANYSALCFHLHRGSKLPATRCLKNVQNNLRASYLSTVPNLTDTGLNLTQSKTISSKTGDEIHNCRSGKAKLGNDIPGTSTK